MLHNLGRVFITTLVGRLGPWSAGWDATWVGWLRVFATWVGWLGRNLGRLVGRAIGPGTRASVAERAQRAAVVERIGTRAPRQVDRRAGSREHDRPDGDPEPAAPVERGRSRLSFGHRGSRALLEENRLIGLGTWRAGYSSRRRETAGGASAAAPAPVAPRFLRSRSPRSSSASALSSCPIRATLRRAAWSLHRPAGTSCRERAHLAGDRACAGHAPC